MAAFDVVGVNLKLGLDVDLGAGGQQQGFAKLMAVGPLCFLADDDPALENGPGLVIQHPLEDFPARGVGCQMFDHGSVVAMFGTAHQIGAVEPGVRAFTFQAHRNFVARQPTADGQVKIFIGGVLGDMDMGGAKVGGVEGFGLDLVMVEPGAFADVDFGDGVGEIGADPHSYVMLDHGGLGAFAEDDQVARKIGDRMVRQAADKNHLEGLFDFDPSIDAEHEA